ncbi:hypothetical protein CIG19_02710 [Enterobacterales bacterium CwR94]|nr:hypothetical protein CIG19_02710 [Enterobacterales bacterium CwR94]
MDNVSVVTFSEIKHRLLDAGSAQLIECIQNTDFDEGNVLLFRGDSDISFLDIDITRCAESLGILTDAEIVWIIVDGNLTVSQWVGNSGEQTGANLIVLGDLIARNALFDNYLVDVTGNLRVSEVLWTDFYEAFVVVAGHTSASFLSTPYHHLLDFSWPQNFEPESLAEHCAAIPHEILDVESLSKIIALDCLDSESDENHIPLLPHNIRERLNQGLPVMCAEALAAESLYFTPEPDHSWVTIDTLLRIAQPHRFSDELEERSAPRFEFWAEDTLCRVTLSGEEDELHALRIVYLQNDTHAMLITIELNDGRSLLDKILRQPLISEWRMHFQVRRFHETRDEKWKKLTLQKITPGQHAFPVEYHRLIATGWHALLSGIATFDHANTLVMPEEIVELLALPIVQPYNDFYDEDKCGFWSGEMHCAFRQAGTLFEGRPQSAVLRVSREYTHCDGRELFEMFYFKINRDIEGKESVFISYKEDQESDAEQIPLSFLGGRLLTQARRALNIARKNLLEANRQLVEDGIPPDWADKFAIAHWRETGVMARISSVRYKQHVFPGNPRPLEDVCEQSMTLPPAEDEELPEGDEAGAKQQATE